MKKMLIPAISAILICAAANDSGAQAVALKAAATELRSQPVFASLEPVQLDEARKMVKNYAKKDARKDKGGYVAIDPEDLALLAEQSDIATVRFVQAAYLSTESDDAKRGRPVTLVLVIRKGGARTVEYYKSRSICPPPESACDAEAEL